MQITLVKYVAADFNYFKRLVSDLETMRYITGIEWKEIEARLQFDAMLEINAVEESLGFFKVVNQKNEFIGNCSLECYKYDAAILEIGYVLKREFWRMGYGSAILQRLVHKANNSFPGMDVIAIIDPENQASRKLLEKNGFVCYFKGVEDSKFAEKFILKNFHTY
ncbi:GNAT family N-acetyltransferase [Sphingobacterium sp. UDSM-2020]|uniref:GNAT family N-acetyltransferase n=1 Tax=Sphingobacterium sp. UDSM-2020 TaxID=2795738 RepID=UPI0019357E77|nr:GNAT family N-acetyltransferase [Sphingobacterium sp. UDSM-2020]QQD12631.1 GNAT family N-acetyltransferase [Sphingobacterium sp. UDSM-2020]